MSSVNKVILIGRLGKDPELRNTKTGTAVCTLSLATSEFRVKDGNKEEKTEWHKVNLWEKMAENASKYLKKGSLVYFEGKLQTNKYEKDGQIHYSTEIVATAMQFLGGGSGEGKAEESRSEISDIPF